ncbi:MAG TPA: hypothetical protein VJP76_02895 [Candidatus Tumulicola sp.]|nr:hypothetical protein [Candidatus Tumulicola sp.]
MNRKELACAAVGAVLGAAGCSPALRSLAVPAANAESAAARGLVAGVPHLEEAVLSLISGTTRDVSTALFHLLPKSGWSITSSDSRLAVSIENGHVAVITAPEDERVHFIARATISHDSGTEFTVRCHVEGSCD